MTTITINAKTPIKITINIEKETTGDDPWGNVEGAAKTTWEGLSTAWGTADEKNAPTRKPWRGGRRRGGRMGKNFHDRKIKYDDEDDEVESRRKGSIVPFRGIKKKIF